MNGVEWLRLLWQHAPVGFVEWFRSLKVGCPTWHGLLRTCQGGSPPPPWRPRLPRTSPPLRGALGLSRLASGRARYGILPFSPSSRIPTACPDQPRTPRRFRWGNENPPLRSYCIEKNGVLWRLIFLIRTGYTDSGDFTYFSLIMLLHSRSPSYNTENPAVGLCPATTSQGRN